MLGRVAGALSSGVAVFGAWFGHRGKRVRMAWVTNLPPLGNFVTHAARNDRGRLTLSLGDSNHARGKRATALRAPHPRIARTASAWRTFAVRRDSGFPTPSELGALDVVVRRRDGE